MIRYTYAIQSPEKPIKNITRYTSLLPGNQPTAVAAPTGSLWIKIDATVVLSNHETAADAANTYFENINGTPEPARRGYLEHLDYTASSATPTQPVIRINLP